VSEKIRCEICGQEFGQITCSHLKKHGLTMAQYRDMYPDAIVAMCSPERAERHSAFMLEYYLDEDNLQANSERVKQAWARGDFDGRNTLEYLHNHSVATKAAWADPDSGLNSKERSEKLSSSLKVAWAEGKFNGVVYPDRHGPNNSFWNGGTSFDPYPIIFNDAFKQIIRDRDNHQCAICRFSGKDVHHIDYNKDNTIPKNCIILCRSCHGVTNGNRDYWQLALFNIMHARGTSP